MFYIKKKKKRNRECKREIIVLNLEKKKRKKRECKRGIDCPELRKRNRECKRGYDCSKFRKRRGIEMQERISLS